MFAISKTCPKSSGTSKDHKNLIIINSKWTPKIPSSISILLITCYTLTLFLFLRFLSLARSLPFHFPVLLYTHNEKVNKKEPPKQCWFFSIFLAHKWFGIMFCRLPKTWASNYFFFVAGVNDIRTHTQSLHIEYILHWLYDV